MLHKYVVPQFELEPRGDAVKLLLFQGGNYKPGSVHSTLGACEEQMQNEHAVQQVLQTNL